MPIKILLTVSFAVVSIAYPAIVYFGIQTLSPAFFAIVLLLIGVGRFCVAKDRRETTQVVLLTVAVTYSLVLMINGSRHFLMLYPVVISTCVGAVFLASLRQSESLIERLARLSGKEITPRAKRYTRKLTLIWATLLFLNAGVALYLAYFASIEQWALYCGLLSYIIFSGFFALEFTYRQYYMHIHRAETGL